MVAMSLQDKEVKVEHKGKVDYYKWDTEEGGWYVSRGWRSWGCVTTISSYLLTMVILTWWAIAGLLAALPFVVGAILVGLGAYSILSSIR